MHQTILLTMLIGIAGIVMPASTQNLSGEALVNALRLGGYVLVMRHASSPTAAPDKQGAQPDNVNLERQLDERGRATAIAMGKALRVLGIPVGDVFTSPTYRARETVRLAELPKPQLQDELGDAGQSMRGVSNTQSDWLKNKVAQLPRTTNTILVTHLPNITAAFPQWAAGLSDGETLVVGSDGKGGVTLVARVKIEQWPSLR